MSDKTNIFLDNIVKDTKEDDIKIIDLPKIYVEEFAKQLKLKPETIDKAFEILNKSDQIIIGAAYSVAAASVYAAIRICNEKKSLQDVAKADATGFNSDVKSNLISIICAYNKLIKVLNLDQKLSLDISVADFIADDLNNASYNWLKFI